MQKASLLNITGRPDTNSRFVKVMGGGGSGLDDNLKYTVQMNDSMTGGLSNGSTTSDHSSAMTLAHGIPTTSRNTRGASHNIHVKTIVPEEPDEPVSGGTDSPDLNGVTLALTGGNSSGSGSAGEVRASVYSNTIIIIILFVVLTTNY